MALNANHLTELRRRPILVIGDPILDRYTWGQAERVSPEAPVLVLRADEREARPGGAASVARLLAALDARVSLAGVVGADEEGQSLRALLHSVGIGTDLLVADASRPTTVKDRYLGRVANRHPHQVLRVDRETVEPISREGEEQLVAFACDGMHNYQAVLISDYAKGVCTPRLLQSVFCAAHDHGLPVIVDPARIADYARYRGARIVVPNRTESELACDAPITGPQDALRAARWLRQHHGFDTVVIKLDADGMVVVDADTEQHVPTRPRRVCDVTGAGDMVLAILGLCQAAGWSLLEAAELANVAAGLEVERLGVAPVHFDEIQWELAPEPRGLVTLQEMSTLADAYRRAGRTIVLTNGCFDLLHVGHVSHLEQAAQLGDVLVVGVNSDASVRRLKGNGRPIVGQRERARMVASLAAVQHVLVFDEDTPHRLLENIRPDVLVKGGDYTPDEVVGRELVTAYGGSVCVTRKTEDVSTSALVRRMNAVGEEEYKSRLEICDGCDQRRGNRCLKCGCRLSLKARGRAFQCPLEKWPVNGSPGADVA